MNSIRAVSLFIVCFGPGGLAQSVSTHGAKGEMTVSATVTASVGVVMGADGEPILVLANAAGPDDGLATAFMRAITPWPNENRGKTPKLEHRSSLTPMRRGQVHSKR